MRGFRVLAFFLGLTVLGLSLPVPAGAAVLGDPQISFSADRLLEYGGKTMSGKLFSRPGAQRHEQDIGGIKQIVLLQGEHSRGWLLLPGLGSFIEFNFAPAMAELGDPDLLGTPLGRERVNGIATTKYRIEHTARDGTEIEGYLWLSHDGIPVKLNGSYLQPNRKDAEKLRMELTNIKPGPQAAALFELPPGMGKLSLEGLKPLLGVGGHGLER